MRGPDRSERDEVRCTAAETVPSAMVNVCGPALVSCTEEGVTMQVICAGAVQLSTTVSENPAVAFKLPVTVAPDAELMVTAKPLSEPLKSAM